MLTKAEKLTPDYGRRYLSFNVKNEDLMTLIKLFSVLKGGSRSGHHGHSGIPGHRGGSAPGVSSKIQRALLSLATNEQRKTLLENLPKDTSDMLNFYGLTSSDVEKISVHGSFVTNKPNPNDIDVLIQVPESVRFPDGGTMDQAWLRIGDRKVNYWLAHQDIYPILQETLSRGTEGHSQGISILNVM